MHKTLESAQLPHPIGECEDLDVSGDLENVTIVIIRTRPPSTIRKVMILMFWEI